MTAQFRFRCCSAGFTAVLGCDRLLLGKQVESTTFYTTSGLPVLTGHRCSFKLTNKTTP